MRTASLPGRPADLRILEVDHAAGLRDKQARLRRAKLAVPRNIRYASADLETDAPGPRPEAAALDPAKPVFVAYLGMLIFGRRDLRLGCLAAGGQRVRLHVLPSDASTSGPPAPGSVAARVAAAVEPWRTRVEPDVMLARLRAAGSCSMDLLLAKVVTERCLRGRTDGLLQPSQVVVSDALA